MDFHSEALPAKEKEAFALADAKAVAAAASFLNSEQLNALNVALANRGQF